MTHKQRMWGWIAFGLAGLVDYLWWPKWGIADSIPVLFGISIAANAIAESAGDEAAP